MSGEDLKEAELLLEAFGWCSNEDRANVILDLVREIISPYVKVKNPRALWLKSGLPNLGEERESFSDEEFELLYLELIKESSDGGCAEAQYSYGCHLYENQKEDEAVELYRKSAVQGYAPGQWCFGLDTLNGIGTTRDEIIGLHYIRLSAEQRYDYAVEFMLRNSKEGKYGLFPEDTEKWEIILFQTEK